MKISPLHVALSVLIISSCTRAADPSKAPHPDPTSAATQAAPLETESALSAFAGPRTYIDLARRLIPSVVNISTVTSIDVPPGQMFPEEFFHRFFNEFGGRSGSAPFAPPRQRPQARALGTGFLIDTQGTILTNHHVVAGASEITIAFTEMPGDVPTKAIVIGRDPELDVALLKVEDPQRKFVPVGFGDSDAVEIGEYVMAVGNPFGQGHSVTHGIISQKGRVAPDFPLTTYLQTDAPINPGNSGGPLVNLRGEVIAISNAIQANAQGIGFAIPINVVKEVLPQLREKGRVSRGYLGVAVQDLDPDLAEKLGVRKDLRAPFVAQVTEGSPGDEAGLRPYDVILRLNGKSVTSSSELVGAVSSTPASTSIPMQIQREGKRSEIRVTLGERPVPRSELESQSLGQNREAPPAKMGVSVRPMTSELARELAVPVKTGGIVVSSVAPGSPAEDAGLKPGDILLEANRRPVRDVESFTKMVQQTSDEILLRVRRPNPVGADTFMAAVVDLSKPGEADAGGR